MIDSENITEVVFRLVGQTNPVGESIEDERRLENLKTLMTVTENIISQIIDVSSEKGHYQSSNKEAGQRAYKFLKLWRGELNCNLDEVDQTKDST